MLSIRQQTAFEDGRSEDGRSEDGRSRDIMLEVLGHGSLINLE